MRCIYSGNCNLVQGYPGSVYPFQGYPGSVYPVQGYPGSVYPVQGYPGSVYPRSSSLYPTRPCSSTLPWAHWIHARTEAVFLSRHISLLYHHPLLGLPRGFLPSVFRRVGEISETYSPLRHVCPSVRKEELCSHWTDFHENWYLSSRRSHPVVW